MRTLILILLLIQPILAFSSTDDPLEKYRYFIDLGGKTINLYHESTSLTGVRAGLIRRHRLNLGIAVFTLSENPAVVSSRTSGDQNQYSFLGIYSEYRYALSDKLLVLPGILAGFGSSKNIQQANSVNYPGLEPSLCLSVKTFSRMWLNVGGSYTFVDRNSGIKRSPLLNIFARYVW